MTAAIRELVYLRQIALVSLLPPQVPPPSRTPSQSWPLGGRRSTRLGLLFMDGSWPPSGRGGWWVASGVGEAGSLHRQLNKQTQPKPTLICARQGCLATGRDSETGRNAMLSHGHGACVWPSQRLARIREICTGPPE